MVNIDDFIKRLEVLLDYYSLSASIFADKLGVQRSGLSHLMSGRNKPSLDFVMKIIENFPEVDFYWLLNGTGNFPKQIGDVYPALQNPAPVIPALASEQSQQKSDSAGPDLLSENKTNVPHPQQEVDVRQSSETIPTDFKVSDGVDRIVIFYNDGSFKSYTSRQ